MYQIIVRTTEEYVSNITGSSTASMREVTILEARVDDLKIAIKLIEAIEPAKVA